MHPRGYRIYTGTLFKTYVSDMCDCACDSNPCGRGICIADGDNFLCNCTGTSFYGVLCDQECDGDNCALGELQEGVTDTDTDGGLNVTNLAITVISLVIILAIAFTTLMAVKGRKNTFSGLLESCQKKSKVDEDRSWSDVDVGYVDKMLNKNSQASVTGSSSSKTSIGEKSPSKKSVASIASKKSVSIDSGDGSDKSKSEKLADKPREGPPKSILKSSPSSPLAQTPPGAPMGPPAGIVPIAPSMIQPAVLPGAPSVLPGAPSVLPGAPSILPGAPSLFQPIGQPLVAPGLAPQPSMAPGSPMPIVLNIQMSTPDGMVLPPPATAAPRPGSPSPPPPGILR